MRLSLSVGRSVNRPAGWLAAKCLYLDIADLIFPGILFERQRALKQCVTAYRQVFSHHRVLKHSRNLRNADGKCFNYCIIKNIFKLLIENGFEMGLVFTMRSRHTVIPASF